MFVLLEGDTLRVYNSEGIVVHKSFGVSQYSKLNEDSLVVITDNTVQLVRQNIEGVLQKVIITSLTITGHRRAMLIEDVLFIYWENMIRRVDIYNTDLDVMCRLHRGKGANWYMMRRYYLILFQLIVPKILTRKYLKGLHGKDDCVVDLGTEKIAYGSYPKVKGMNLVPVLEIISKEVAK